MVLQSLVFLCGLFLHQLWNLLKDTHKLWPQLLSSPKEYCLKRKKKQIFNNVKLFSFSSCETWNQNIDQWVTIWQSNLFYHNLHEFALNKIFFSSCFSIGRVALRLYKWLKAIFVPKCLLRSPWNTRWLLASFWRPEVTLEWSVITDLFPPGNAGKLVHNKA